MAWDTVTLLLTVHAGIVTALFLCTPFLIRLAPHERFAKSKVHTWCVHPSLATALCALACVCARVRMVINCSPIDRK